jgi:hypothetical protein
MMVASAVPGTGLSPEVVENVAQEPIARANEFLLSQTIDSDLLRQTIQFTQSKTGQLSRAMKTSFPAPSSVNGVYLPIGNVEWTSGFWTGLLWLAYELSGDLDFRSAAMSHLRGYQQRIRQRINVAHHDLGFLFSLSAVPAFKRLGDATAGRMAYEAAELLLARYLPSAGIIQAWGDLDDPAQRGRMIIDCNLNLPLLFWASAMSGDDRFEAAARQHLTKAAEHLVRGDASTFHTFFMDPIDGTPLYGKTHQGYADDSCWARGQAWAIYGFAIGARHTSDPELVKLSKRVTNYFLNRMPVDGVCYWDLVFTDGPQPRDTSAATIAACGMLELSDLLPPDDADRLAYRSAAIFIVQQLATKYLTTAAETESGILRHAVYHMPNNIGVDESCIWGDYFFVEALARLRGGWSSYW